MSWQESKKRKIHFLLALLLCVVLTPIFGYLVISNRPLRISKACTWCGNQQKESQYCGVCKKDEQGHDKIDNLFDFTKEKHRPS
jgi:hypothetical protein